MPKRLKGDPNRILSIDPSPRGTGIILLESSILKNYWFFTETISVAKKNPNAVFVPKVSLADESTRMERLYIVRDFMADLCLRLNPAIVALEDYTFGNRGKGGGQLQIGELGGIVRLWLWEHYYRTRTYHPGTVKLFWTGNGDADKDDMIRVAVDRLVETGNPLLDEFAKLAKKYQEAVADAYAIGSLLEMELAFRRGEWLLNEQPENVVRVFNRVTDSMPVCLIDRPFMQREK
jgi:Holliday junction resolvasome RuvABC endonuclease subunit